jgi:uncharacterized RDD family membrane protein YckC
MKLVYFITRTAAFFIDYLFLLIMLICIFKIPLYANTIDDLLNSLIFVVIFAFIIPTIYLFFQSLLLYKFGGSIGKLIIGLHVTKNYTKLTLFESLFRTYIGPIINNSVFGLGYIWFFIDEKRRGWHDLACNTIVTTNKYNRVLLGALIFVIQCIIATILLVQSISLIIERLDFYTTIVNDISTSVIESSKKDDTKKRNNLKTPLQNIKTNSGTQI